MSIDTKSFKTRTIHKEKKNPSVEDFWPIALDIGYSSVKGMSPNQIYSFPSFAIRTDGPMLEFTDAEDSEILYKDEKGVMWRVGESAQNMVTPEETNISSSEIYSRHRYSSPMFLVVARVGLALGMIGNSIGNPDGKKIHIQTGLPPKYMSRDDKDALRESLSGIHDFQVKIGKKPWQHISFKLNPENIDIISQPMGTLFSVMYDNNANFVSDAVKLAQSDVLIFDPGFGTLDIFHIRGRSLVGSPDTYDDLGMKRVFEETSRLIQSEYGVQIPVVSFQKPLEDGFVKQFNRKERNLEKRPFADMLETASKKVCMEALERVGTGYNELINQDYLIVTGGTGAAWFEYISDYYKGMETLTILPGNRNDKLPYIFANVRGYYMAMVYGLRAKVKAKQ